MTRKEEAEKWKSLVLSYYENGLEGLKANLEAVKLPRDKSLSEPIDRLIQGGDFAWNYYACMEDMAGIYGEAWEESRYYNSDKSLKWRGGEAYCWKVYKAKITQAILKLLEEGEA